MIYESGILESIESLISKLVFKSKFTVHLPKPFSCAFCMTFWTLLIYLLCADFTFLSAILVALSFAYLVNPATILFHIIIDFIECVIKFPTKYIKF